MTPDELREIEQFAAEIVEHERTHANPAREAAEDVAWSRLQAQFPGEFVAYLDTWDGDVLTREVLAHDENVGKLIAIAETWPQETQERARTDYVDPPSLPPTMVPIRTQPRASA